MTVGKRDTKYTEQLTMIVRTAEERTTDLCRKLIEDQGIKKKIYFSLGKRLSLQL